jgi:uncharacterized protein (TIGR03437 family)
LEKILRTHTTPLTKVFALAFVVLASHADLARAQVLNYQNPATLTISGPGSSASQGITVTSSASASPVVATLGTPTTNAGGTWLCATASANVLTVSAGPGCGVGTTGLTAGTNYTGNVQFTVDGGATQNLTVNLTVGTSSGGIGLSANPNPLNFNLAAGSSVTSQTVNVTFNGSLTPLSFVSTSTTTGQAWLSASIISTGVVQVTVNPTILGSGTYTGSVAVTTTSNGSLSFTVNLNLGTGGTSGLVVSPSSLTFNAAIGSGNQTQNVFLTYNGSAINVNSISQTTTTGQNWLQPANTGVVGTVMTTVTPAILSTGTYFGTVYLTTSVGTATYQVTLTVGSGGSISGLAASPNPLTLNVPVGQGSSQQNVNITYNGSPIAITSVSATTNTGQSWLSVFQGGNTGTVTVNFNPSILSIGNYTGTVFVNTTVGSLSFTVNLGVGTSGGNSAGLAATPNPVNFNIPLVGSGTSPQTVNVTYNGFPATITSISQSTVGQNWLIASQSATTGAVSLAINGANLTAGSYSGTLTVNTTSGTINIPVNLTVGTGSTTGLSATPNPVVLNVAVGTSSSTQNVSVTYNGSPATINSVSASTTTGVNWLQASTSGTVGAVTVTVTPSSLAAGSYTGTVTVNTTVGVLNFQVNLTVGTTSGLVATPNPVTLTSTVGGSSASQTVTVTSNGSPATITGISSSTTTGANWLQAFTSGTLGSVTVSGNAASLAAGTYTGTVTVTTSVGATSFQVNLTVGSGTGTSGVTANPSTITFNVAAAGQGGSQVVTASFNGTPTPIQNATFVPQLTGLTFVNTQVNADGTVTLTVNSVVTTPGTYQGTLNLFTVPGNVSVPVVLQFGTGTGTTGLAANPNPVTFTVQTGGAVPSQNVAITFNGFAVTVSSVTPTTTTGQNWLLPSASGTTGTVVVAVNALGLTAGSYSGTVTVTTTSGTFSFQVNLTVGGGTTPGSPTVVVTPTTLTPVSFQVGGAAPQSQSIAVSMVGGGALGFTAAATTASGGTWLAVSPASGTTPGTVTVSFNTTGLTAGTYQGTVTITVSGATNSPVTLPVTLTVTAPAVVTPTVVAIQNAASTLPSSLSPGLNIVIFGSNMGPATLATLVVGSNGALATTVSGTQVTFDGVAAPIIFTSSNQVSVMVPYEIANRATTSLVVSYNGVSSAATQLRVVDAAPGIYTVNSSGSGQGAILNQNGTVNSAGNPEVAGNVIQIFATGEGQTSPGGSSGAITPGRLPTPTPTLPVTVTIGGVSVPASDILFAGEAPGAVSGVLQVNARVPAGAGTGPVAVVIRVGGTASQSNVTVSLR